MEYEEQADRMEEDADKLEQHNEQLGERIGDIKNDWERKEQDRSVPGAQPDPGEETTSEDGGPVMETPDQSDQLPEEGQDAASPDDTGGEHGTDNPGVPGEEETSTGNPDAAGAED
jgi:hypothetical protein